MGFVNREKELELLTSLYRKGEFQFVPIYGRRRVGKTKLVQEFTWGKDSIYFLADMVAEKEQLKNLGREVAEYTGDTILKERGFADWYQFFLYVKEKAGRYLVLAIDEFPYLVASNKAISSIFQKGIDEYLKDSPVMLLLLGSSVGMMEKEVLSYRAPLYGRRTGSLEVKPLSFFDIGKFFPGQSFDFYLSLYSVFGTIPAYLEKVDPSVGIFENIRALILKKGSYFSNEVEFLLREELREPRNYFVILRSIAGGKRKLGEIMNDTGFEKSMLSRYLDILMSLGFVEKEIPVTEKRPHKSRSGLYKIKDRFINFWFKFVFSNRSRLEIERTDHVLEAIRAEFERFMSENYEEVTQSVCIEMMKKGMLNFTRIGRWWRKNEEVDIVAIDEGNRVLYMGECKWSTKKVGTDIYKKLKEKTDLLTGSFEGYTVRYMLFSKRGFTKGMREMAKGERTILVEKDRVICLPNRG